MVRHKEFLESYLGKNRTFLFLAILEKLEISLDINQKEILTLRENNKPLKIDIGMQDLFAGFAFGELTMDIKDNVNIEIFKFTSEILSRLLEILLWRMIAKFAGIDVRKLNILVAKLIKKGGSLKPHQIKENGGFVLEVSLPNKKNPIHKFLCFNIEPNSLISIDSKYFLTVDGLTLPADDFSSKNLLQALGEDVNFEKNSFLNVDAVQNFLKSKVPDNSLIIYSLEKNSIENAKSYRELNLALADLPVLHQFIFLENNGLKINYAKVTNLDNVCGLLLVEEELTERKKQSLSKKFLDQLRKDFYIKENARVVVLTQKELTTINKIEPKINILKQKNVALLHPFQVEKVRAHFNNVDNTLGGTQIVVSTHLNNKRETKRQKTILDFGLPPGINSGIGFASLLHDGYLIRQDGIYKEQAGFSDIELLATLLSHGHKDHTEAVPFLLPNTLVGLPLTLAVILDQYKNSKNIDLNVHRLQPIYGDGELLQLSDNIFVRSYLLNHTIPTVGYELYVCQNSLGRGGKQILTKIAYPSDYADTNLLKEMAQKSNLFILDGTKPVNQMINDGSMESLFFHYKHIINNCNAHNQLIITEMMKYDFEYLSMLYKLAIQNGRTLVLSPRIARRLADLQITVGATRRESRDDLLMDIDLSSPAILILEKDKKNKADLFAEYYERYQSITSEKICLTRNKYLVVREADEDGEEIARLDPGIINSVLYLSDPHSSVVSPALEKLIRSKVWQHPFNSHRRIGHAELVARQNDRHGNGVLSVILSQNPAILAVVHSLKPDLVSNLISTYLVDDVSKNASDTQVITRPKTIDLK